MWLFVGVVWPEVWHLFERFKGKAGICSSQTGVAGDGRHDKSCEEGRKRGGGEETRRRENGGGKRREAREPKERGEMKEKEREGR